MPSTLFLVIYSKEDYDLAQELGTEISSTFDIEYALGSYDDLDDTELSQRFLTRSRQKMAQSSFSLIIASDELFDNPILSQIAQEAIEAKKALCIFIPSTKNFPSWFPKLQSVRLASDSTVNKAELGVIFAQANRLFT